MQNFGTNSSMQVPRAYLCSLFLSALSQVTATGSAQTMEPLINALTDTDVEKPKKKKERKQRKAKQPPANYIKPWNLLPVGELSLELGRSFAPLC